MIKEEKLSETLKEDLNFQLTNEQKTMIRNASNHITINAFVNTMFWRISAFIMITSLYLAGAKKMLELNNGVFIWYQEIPVLLLTSSFCLLVSKAIKKIFINRGLLDLLQFIREIGINPNQIEGFILEVYFGIQNKSND